jgi:hypothetical protein
MKIAALAHRSRNCELSYKPLPCVTAECYRQQPLFEGYIEVVGDFHVRGCGCW